jgi:hypothetical protein
MQIDYVKISCKEDVQICCTNVAKQMEQNLHETTSRWKTYGKRLFSEDLEVRDAVITNFLQQLSLSCAILFSTISSPLLFILEIKIILPKLQMYYLQFLHKDYIF